MFLFIWKQFFATRMPHKFNFGAAIVQRHYTSNEIRQQFLDYFQSRGHRIVASSPLIPGNDPTLLFTNAGMVQFKDTFLGIEQRPYSRAASSQRCVRAGGKHNDLENVGYTRRHHTFFEMLGNFSFGDYFKREAIEFAWRFLTEDMGIPKEKLWVTVFQEDTESEDIWFNHIKIDPKRFSRCGAKDNFWQMGDTGPCGPCTEIFYDHGAEIEGGPPGSPDADGDRYVEIWNIVFMQFDRDSTGQLHPLPRPCVDTGMGLERIAAVLQGVHDNYDIDLFQHLLKALAKIIGHENLREKSMRVIVDHIRSTAFLIADSVIPSNEGRGYVLRRIMRRAIRHGFKLGCKKPFFFRLVAPLVAVMGEAYPELVKSQALIEQIIQQEEEQFSKTLTRGLKILDQAIAELSSLVLPGTVVFQLYDTYGFPPDLTADIARERGLTLDTEGFEEAMQQQREQSQQSQAFSVDQTERILMSGGTEFVGYDAVTSDAKIVMLLDETHKPLKELVAKQQGVVILDRTPFYAESGGQVGDFGYLDFGGGRFKVTDTQKQGDTYLHVGEVESGQMNIDQMVHAKIDLEHRQAVRLNHTATHLLHEALRQVLGEHVRQKGSLVAAERLRFDFSHSKPMSAQELQAVERLVNREIRANIAAQTTTSTPEEAKAKGAIAFFGERYGDNVRVLKLGEFSTEICGGTHVSRTGDIGLFKITTESACASGVRRIEAVTGQTAIEYILQNEEQLNRISDRLKTHVSDIDNKISQLIQQNRDYERELAKAKQHHANRQVDNLAEQAVEIGGVKVLAAQLQGVDRDTLRNTLDQLKQKLENSAIVLSTVHEEQIQLVAAVSKDCLPYFNAVQLLNQVAGQVGGKGGGRPEMAQGGGNNPGALAGALQSVTDWAKTKLTH